MKLGILQLNQTLKIQKKTKKRKIEKQEDEQVKDPNQIIINKKIEKVSEQKIDTEVQKEPEKSEKENKINSLFEARKTFDLAELPDKRRRNTCPGTIKFGLKIAMH